MSGHNYAKIKNVKAGTELIADGGFTCIPENARLTVYVAADGNLEVPCSHGGHGLSGQAEDDHYVGFILG